MSEDRETPAGAPAAHEEPKNESSQQAGPGAPIEEGEASTTEVRAAVDRAGVLGAPEADPPAATGASQPQPGEAPQAASSPAPEAPVASDVAAAGAPAPQAAPATERPTIAESGELPSAGPNPAPAAQLHPGATTDADGNIVISSDHPMAALYMQTPMQPEMRGNRGAGVMISILATIVFALIYTGVLALAIAPTTPPSRFVGQLTETALWPVIGASAMFLIGLVILVLIVGRAGWWAYVLGGFLVAIAVWAGAVAGMAYGTFQAVGSTGLADLLPTGSVDMSAPGPTLFNVVGYFGLTLPAIAAAVVAREATVWFGAWIGARGRKVTRKNAEALAEYEKALAEAQAKQP